MKLPRVRIPKIRFRREQAGGEVAAKVAQTPVAEPPFMEATAQPTPTAKKRFQFTIHKRAWAGIKSRTPRQLWLRRRERVLKSREGAYAEVFQKVDLKKWKLTAEDAQNIVSILARNPKAKSVNRRLRNHVNKLVSQMVRERRKANA
jgi:hypothetical protein